MSCAAGADEQTTFIARVLPEVAGHFRRLTPVGRELQRVD
jgi:hypothetical protein